MSTTKRRSLAGSFWLLAFAALCVSGTPNAYSNATYVKGSSTTVKFGDLNLQHPDGARELYRRIENAARKVCRKDAESYLASVRSMQYCVNTAVANAVQQVNNQNLSALHSKKRPGTFG